MKIQIDLKSALLGVGIGVLAVFTIGAGTSSNPVGKYQVAVGAPGAAVLDTQTGEVWAMPNTTEDFDNNNHNKKDKFWDAKNN